MGMLRALQPLCGAPNLLQRLVQAETGRGETANGGADATTGAAAPGATAAAKPADKPDIPNLMLNLVCAFWECGSPQPLACQTKAGNVLTCGA